MRRRPLTTFGPLLGLLSVALVSCGDRDPILFPSTAEIRIVDGAELEGPAGLPLTPPPEIRAVDSRGNPTPGVTVEFSVLEGDGSVSPATMLTDEQGFAKPDEWVLDETVGTNVLAVDVDGVGRTEFTAQGVPGPPAQLTRVAGDRQEAEEGETLPDSIVVLVMDQFGNPVPSALVTFEPAEGSGSASPSQALTDAEGMAATSWTLGPGEGTQRLTALTEPGAGTTFTANGVFLIDLVFVQEPDPAYRTAFENAAARWESVMADGLTPIPMDLEFGDCGGDSPAVTQVVEDVLIFVSLRSLDPNILGQAGPCYIRLPEQEGGPSVVGGGLPVVGVVILNSNLLGFMEAQGTLETVILHEIGHVLGIGTLWDLTLQDGTVVFDFLRDPALPNNRDADPHFDGPLAVSAFDGAGGLTYQGPKVPVENDFDRFSSPQGSLDSHWRISVFGNELMVGQIDATAPAHPLSAVTIASLADLGYEVDMAEADPFSILEAMRLPPAEAPIQFHDDIYRGPIGVVDRSGRRVHEFLPAPAPHR